MKKSTSKRKVNREPGLTEALDAALAAEPKDIKVHISLRLDSDIYMELQRRAEAGEAKGKYQALLNQLLRQALFGSETEDSFETERAGKLWQLLKDAGYLIESKESSVARNAREMMRNQPPILSKKPHHARLGKK